MIEGPGTIRPGTTILDMTTGDPDEMERMGKTLAAQGVTYIERRSADRASRRGIRARIGPSLGDTLEVFRAGPAYSRAMDIKGRRMIERDFCPQLAFRSTVNMLI